MTQTLTITVSTELADAFEAHGHLLAPATVVGETPSANPFWRTYLVHHPHAPAGVTNAVPILQRSSQGAVSVLGWEWCDAHGSAVRPPPAHVSAQ